jgi:hypothetical protein
MEEINDVQLQLPGVNQEINLLLLKIMSNFGISMPMEYKNFNKLNPTKILFSKLVFARIS